MDSRTLKPLFDYGMLSQNHTTQFRIGMLVYVLPHSELPNALFKSDQLNEDDLCGWLRPGEIVQVVAGPHHNHSMKLWQVRSLARDVVGWTSQRLGEDLFMAPLQIRLLCEDSLASRLQIGMTARVALTQSLPISLLQTPKIECGNYIDSLFSGTEMRIINGPICAGDIGQGMVFWKVRLNNGLEGWTAECSQQTYWLEPLYVNADHGLRLALP